MSLPAVPVAPPSLIKTARLARGLSALHQNERLSLAGSRHARDMVRARYFSHDSRGGSAFDDRISRTGYARGRRATVGENLAWGTGSLATPRAIVRSWMNSPG